MHAADSPVSWFGGQIRIMLYGLFFMSRIYFTARAARPAHRVRLPVGWPTKEGPGGQLPQFVVVESRSRWPMGLMCHWGKSWLQTSCGAGATRPRYVGWPFSILYGRATYGKKRVNCQPSTSRFVVIRYRYTSTNLL
jgi:hypothetical protein